MYSLFMKFVLSCVKSHISQVMLACGFLALVLATHQAGAQDSGDRLIMIHSSSCPWCEQFDEEIGISYSNTPEGKILPLERIDYYAEFPDKYQIISPASFTPTFIILNDFKEVGRIEGYPGRELFWWRLSEFVPLPQ